MAQLICSPQMDRILLAIRTKDGVGYGDAHACREMESKESFDAFIRNNFMQTLNSMRTTIDGKTINHTTQVKMPPYLGMLMLEFLGDLAKSSLFRNKSPPTGSVPAIRNYEIANFLGILKVLVNGGNLCPEYIASKDYAYKVRILRHSAGGLYLSSFVLHP